MKNRLLACFFCILTVAAINFYPTLSHSAGNNLLTVVQKGDVKGTFLWLKRNNASNPNISKQIEEAFHSTLDEYILTLERHSIARATHPLFLEGEIGDTLKTQIDLLLTFKKFHLPIFYLNSFPFLLHQYAILHNCPETLAFLIDERGLTPNLKNENGMTPLMLAAQTNNLKIARLLLQKGANPNERNDFDTALILSTRQQNIEMTKLLLEKGARVNDRIYSGETSIWEAIRGQNNKMALLLIKNQARVDIFTNFGDTPVLQAARIGEPSIIKIILEGGGKINASNKIGETALHQAAASGHVEMTRVLIKSGANLHSKNKEGQTPLLLASGKNKNDSVVTLLVELGADPHTKDKKGETAYTTAKRSGFKNYLKIFTIPSKPFQNPSQKIFHSPYKS